jgi:3-hydroxyacyl-CoA dehydrogenase/3a,7a,12a-trihydroxy-5b-cholest-24-enoyl-CoA hydratase
LCHKRLYVKITNDLLQFRVVVTSSTSGLYGSFGQINYSAAKMGLVGFSHTLAMEGSKYNILSNVIVPIAYSRMSATVMAPEMGEIMKPVYVAPIVAYLCHEDCTDTGGVFECAGGWAGKVRLQQSQGATFNKPITIEQVRDQWGEVCDWTRVTHHRTAAEVGAMVVEKFSDTGDESDSEEVSVSYTFTSSDIILYALGVGAEISQTDTSELKFLFEGHEDFSAIPSYAVLPAMNSALNGVMARGIPGLKEFSLANALHGEQYVELRKPFPTEGTVTCVGRLVDVLDKKSGAVIIVDIETMDEAGDLLSINQFTTFIVGAGGFGGKRSSQHAKPTVPAPSRAPDASLRHKTLPIQAALYRLSGDYNPLHIDADFAKIGGFSTPILHGLCSYGIATRHIMRQYCNNDATMVKAIKTRFVKPVLPGETIQTDMWREGSRIHFKCKSVESGNVVLDGGYVDLDPAKLASISTTNASSAPPEGDAGLKSSAVFEELKQHVASTPDIVRKVKAVFLWNITKAGKRVAQWTADLKNAPGAVYYGEPRGEKAGCTLTLSDDNFIGLVSGELKAQQLFMQGKLKLSGNIMLSQKLQVLFEARSKL